MLHTFVPRDRVQSIFDGTERTDSASRHDGTALFADIASFTPLCESLALTHGTRRGAELLAATIDRLFGAIGEAVHENGGSVIAFEGDALSCWFAGESADRAVAAALRMQLLVARFGAIAVPAGEPIELGIKIGVATGACTRVVVGDPDIRRFDVASGEAVDRCAAAEKLATQGEVVVDRHVVAALGGRATIGEMRGDYAVIESLEIEPDPAPWPPLDDTEHFDRLFRQWVQPTIFERITASDQPLLAEFRPVASMFLGINSIDHDRPEDVQELDEIIRQTQAIVLQHGGEVLAVSAGDKGTYLVISFGAPVTYGNDRRRAVAAAHELRADLGDRCQAGIYAGRVFAGLFSGEVFSTYNCLGEVMNTAARLMTAARPGQVLVGAPAAVELDRRFQLDPLEPIRLKGIDAPVAVSELLRSDSKSPALSEPRSDLPMVGREVERQAIQAALERVIDGNGEIVSIVGDAGIGKSRLLSAAISDAVRRGFAVTSGECQPHETGSPYQPLQPILHELLGLSIDALDQVRIAVLSALLQANAPQSVPLAPLLGEALGLSLPETDSTRDMPSPVRRQARHELIVGVIRERAAAGPICIVIEDLHWADSSTADLLRDLEDALNDVPVLIITALRPLELGDRAVLPVGNVVELDDLPPLAAERLAVQLLEHLGDAQPDPDDVREVVERAGGHPFFLAELAREVVKGGLVDLPTSLEGLILHRLDQLPERVQRTARMASIVGRNFSTQVLHGAYERLFERGELTENLDRLEESALVLADASGEAEAYLFRHALVHEVAYKTLSFGLRERLHEQVAQFLEATAENPPVELLVFHFARTANTEKEGHYRRLAAERAIHAGAFADALEHLDRAVEILSDESETSSALAEEVKVRLLLGTTLQMLHGQSSSLAKVAYDRARELTHSLPPGPDLGRAVFGLWAYYLFQGQMGPAAELADEAVKLTDRGADPTLRVMAQLAVSQTHRWTGDFARHEAATMAVYAGYDPDSHESYVTQYTQNPRFTAASGYITSLWEQGRLDDSLAEAERSRAEARALQHPFSLSLVEAGQPIVAYGRSVGHDAVESVAERLLEAAKPTGNPVYISWAQTTFGYAAVLRGEHDAGIAQIVTELDRTSAMEIHIFDPIAAAILADAMRRAGRFDDGLRVLDRMTPSFVAGGRVVWSSEHAKLRAELLLGREPDNTAEPLALLDGALETSRSYNTSSLELRVALVRARLLRELDRDDWDLDLADALARLPQGHDDPIPTAASTLLADGRAVQSNDHHHEEEHA